jgi:lysophospholipid acyltransferase (LPLAT)-like uncharacterized protein
VSERPALPRNATAAAPAGPSRRRRTRTRAALQAVVATLIDAVARFIWWTARIRVHVDDETRHLLADPRRPVLFCCWHGRMGMGIWYVRALARAGRPVAVLISPSIDGDLVTRVALGWGLRVVRGSSTRSGVRGLRDLYRAVRDGVSTMLLVDGPKGPPRRCKPGPVMLARLAGVPIVPIGWVSAPEWRAGSWDRFAVPWPFGRMTVEVGAPIAVGRRGEMAGREATVLEVERSLEALEADARRANA